MSTAKPRKAPNKVPKVSRLRKPDEMSLEEWQIALRRQFGRDQKFGVKNRGDHPIFSEFSITNPLSGRSYRVLIRGSALGENHCSCPDFAVNTLGTCKHIEFMLGKLERRRGVKKALAMGYRPRYSEVFLQYGAKREIVFRAGSDCPPALGRLASDYFGDDGCLKPDAYARFHVFLAKLQSHTHAFRCHDDALAYVAQIRDRENLARKIDEAFPKGAASAGFKTLVSATLYPYQRQGALFAARAGRCLLADDMGLGKTIQAIAATEILARCAGVERVLVVTPTSLKHQWQQEIERFTGRRAVVVEGLLPERRRRYKAESFLKITNYDVIHRDLDAIRGWRPDLVILDEAQRIKNWKTRAAMSVKRIESPYAFVLTGTPLENRLEELHSIVEFVDRFRLGPMFRFLAEHQHCDPHGRVVGYHNLSKIAETLSPILVRRTKENVLKELPERMEKRFFVEMTPQQIELHEDNRDTVARIVNKWRRMGFLNEADQLSLQIALQNMRMSCDSTYLLDQETDHGRKADEMAQLLDEILEDPEAKVVVFSQWRRMHELVVRRLEKRGLRYVFFHGGVPSQQRKELVRRFREERDCRLFLSTDAGGVGLNLQHASVVINLDQPWNPAVLEQRVGRVHRLGQQRPVLVVHFIAQSSIEEGMLELLKFKRSMFSGVLDSGENEVFLGGSRLANFMETVEKATVNLAGKNGKSSAPNAAPVQPAGAKPAPGRRGETIVAVARAAAGPRSGAAAGASGGESAQAWSELINAGLTLLSKLGEALAPGAGGAAPSSPLVARDEATGESYLRLPMPNADALNKLAAAISSLTGKQ